MNVNPRVFDRAVNFLGAVLLLCVAGIIAVVLLTDDSIPDVLQNIAIGSLTGLVGLLSQRGGDDDNPVPVTLMNEPVETTEVTKPRKRVSKEAGQAGLPTVAWVLVIVLIAVVLVRVL